MEEENKISKLYCATQDGNGEWQEFNIEGLDLSRETLEGDRPVYMDNKIKIYYKLVRDRIPEIIEASGKKAKYRVLSDEEYKQALKDKLLEEVNEFLTAETKEDMAEEIADIEEVLSAIVIVYGCYSHIGIRNNKGNKKGRFNKRYFLESVEDEEGCDDN